MAGTRARSRKGKQAVRNRGLPAWLLVVIGIVIGAGLMAWVNHSGRMPVSRNDQAARPTAQAAQPPTSAGIAAQGKTSKPRYDFYSILPEKEVVIPDAQITAQAQAEQQATTTHGTDTTGTTPTTTTGAAPSAASGDTGQNAAGHYMLQIASFPNSSDAEALKAKLALQGFRADIEPAKINGQTWNRVRLGPYANASQLEAVKDKLDAAGIHAIALKVK